MLFIDRGEGGGEIFIKGAFLLTLFGFEELLWKLHAAKTVLNTKDNEPVFDPINRYLTQLLILALRYVSYVLSFVFLNVVKRPLFSCKGLFFAGKSIALLRRIYACIFLDALSDASACFGKLDISKFSARLFEEKGRLLLIPASVLVTPLVIQVKVFRQSSIFHLTLWGISTCLPSWP